MKRTLVIIAAVCLLMTGCARNEFSVSSVRIRQDRTDDVRSAVFTFFPSDEEETYGITLTSPDGSITWKGNALSMGDGSHVLKLEITPGTDFPEGEYGYTIYSSNGTELSGSVSFAGAVDVSWELDWPTVTWSVPGTVYGVERDGGTVVAVTSPLDLTPYRELMYTDENFNTYSFTTGE